MSGVRWTTAVGIAIGGGAGALAALLGSPQAPTRSTSAPLAPAATASASASASASAPDRGRVDAPAPTGSAPASSGAAEPASDVGPASDAPAAVASVAPAAPSAAAEAAAPLRAPGVRSPPALEPPATRDALLKAMLFCDQKRDFDECGRAAEALERGTAGPADLAQAKRFRRIALTHLVAQCEAGAPHACFVLAAKYRAGTELAASPASAEALERRGLELCRSRSAPECPAP